MTRLQSAPHVKAPIPDEQWVVYRRVIAEARRRGLEFALGGGFAVATYTGQWRNSKDIDLYVVPETREAMIQVTREQGLRDIYEQQPYDRGWIYRSACQEVIVDVMWSMANHKSPVDRDWLTRGAEIVINDEHLRVLPPEEMLWDKLYVMQRDRCDWPEALKLLYSTGPRLDWEHVFRRVGDDSPLLTGILSVFAWLCPGRAQELPAWLWERVNLPPPPSGERCLRTRAELLDRRPWFQPLENARC